MPEPRPGVWFSTQREYLAFLAFAELDDDERREIVEHFCHGCWRFLEPQEHCHCQNDE